MPHLPWTAFFDVKGLTRYLLAISASLEPVPPKNYLNVEVPAHLYPFKMRSA
jgi:hypothetical protein